MFDKVLIAEDHQSVNRWIQGSLKELGCGASEYAYDCDNALKLLQLAHSGGIPFDLLITDLSFRNDGQERRLAGGAELIGAARLLQPQLKVLVFSAEEQPGVVSTLVERFKINGYLWKGPRDEEDLPLAVRQIAAGKTFISRELQQAVRSKNALDFTEYDMTIITELAKGTLQKNIPYVLEKQGHRSASLRSVEKRLGEIRDTLGFTKNEQLIAYCKDHWII